MNIEAPKQIIQRVIACGPFVATWKSPNGSGETHPCLKTTKMRELRSMLRQRYNWDKLVTHALGFTTRGFFMIYSMQGVDL